MNSAEGKGLAKEAKNEYIRTSYRMVTHASEAGNALLLPSLEVSPGGRELKCQRLVATALLNPSISW